MKIKLILIVLICLLIQSCKQNQEEAWADAPTRFVISNVSTHHGLNAMELYSVEIIDPNGLSYNANDTNDNLKFTFTDSVGKFRIGDVINFKNKNVQ